VKVTVVNQDARKYVEVNDYLPAGLEAVDPRLKTTDPARVTQLETERRQSGPVQTGKSPFRAPWYRGYFSPWQQVQVRDDRVTLSAATLSPGVSEYIYYARATAVGTFFVPPVRGEEANFPDVFGRSDSSTFTVAP
jgi:alpha-2-macroglobulin